MPAKEIVTATKEQKQCLTTKNVSVGAVSDLADPAINGRPSIY